MYIDEVQTKLKRYNNKTIEEIDAELENALEEDKKRVKRDLIILVTIIFLLMPDAFLYWLRFGFPHFASEKTNETIDLMIPPKQELLNNTEENSIKYRTLENRGEYELIKLATYSVSGQIVAKNYYFWGNYLPWGDRPFQSISLIDIGLVWGDFIDKDLLKDYRFVSVKTPTARSLRWRVKRRNSSNYYTKLNSQLSHTHIIPASSAIMHVLLTVPKNKHIKLKGYLVDVKANGRIIAYTSLSRTDSNKSSRGANKGGGACEIMYVEEVQIGNRIYR